MQTAATGPSDRRGRFRLAEQAGESIDRAATFRFRFDGRGYDAHPGDTIASALTAAGIKTLSRSFKYHRPRGLLCCSGHCPNCLVQVGDEPNVRACMRPVEKGMQVESQNAWPSLKYDWMSLSRFGARFLPVGFYYKTFIRPPKLWPFYERFIRRVAGLGVAKSDARLGRYDKQYLHAELVVVGGGPAGVSAALAAAESGAKVLLCDDNPDLGGHLRYASEVDEGFQQQLAAVRDHPAVTVLTETSVIGCYEDDWLAAEQGLRLLKIRAGAVLVATGAYETPSVFDGNDLPGVMLASGLQRMVRLQGVAPGQRALVVTANDDGWKVAADLEMAGVKVAAVVDERTADQCGSLHPADVKAAGVPVFFGHSIVAARGGRSVIGATVAPVDESGDVDMASSQDLSCDLIALSVGWTPATGFVYLAGGKSRYQDSRAEILPNSLRPGLFVAGRAAGSHELETQLLEGRLAGCQAAAYLEDGKAPDDEQIAELQRRKQAEPLRTSARLLGPGKKKRFVCFCEDVTEADIQTSIDEGYDSIELLKRYSTVSMGPCQGRMCSMNSIRLCARATGRTVEQTGTTTARPPTSPVTLGALAGQNMEPVQVTSVHDWHLARGASMMVAGVWMRPEHYGDLAAEVKAVRERVGLIDVSPLGKLRLTGPGVPQLLQRLYVNKWMKLGVGRVRYGVMCSDEGIVLDDGVSARLQENDWYMSTTSSGAGGIYDWVQWWVQSGWGEGVQVTNVTDHFVAFNLAGPRTREVLAGLTAIDLSNDAFPYMSVRSGDVAGVPCRLLRIGFTGELSYEIHSPTAYGLHLWEALMAAGEKHGILPFGVEAQRVLRLEKGHLIVGQDTDGMSDAISANIEWAVKLDKEDFLGKRNLSRISEAGVTQRLVGFKVPAGGRLPEEGLQIVRRSGNGTHDIIGWITSSRRSPTVGGIIGLCWLPVEVAEQNGAGFTIYIDGDLQEAHVHHGAFYDPEGERLRS